VQHAREIRPSKNEFGAEHCRSREQSVSHSRRPAHSRKNRGSGTDSLPISAGHPRKVAYGVHVVRSLTDAVARASLFSRGRSHGGELAKVLRSVSPGRKLDKNPATLLLVSIAEQWHGPLRGSGERPVSECGMIAAVLHGLGVGSIQLDEEGRRPRASVREVAAQG
jgi:hypothetical protein